MITMILLNKTIGILRNISILTNDTNKYKILRTDGNRMHLYELDYFNKIYSQIEDLLSIYDEMYDILLTVTNNMTLDNSVSFSLWLTKNGIPYSAFSVSSYETQFQISLEEGKKFIVDMVGGRFTTSILDEHGDELSAVNNIIELPVVIDILNKNLTI